MGAQHHLFTLARHARGMSQTELAEAMGTSQWKVSDIESGRSPLMGKYLTAASRALNVPENFFEQEPPRHATDTAPFHHRKLQSVGAIALAQNHARMCLIQLQIQELLHDSPERQDAPGFKPMEPEEYKGGPREIAQLLRLMWGVPSGPIPNLLDLAERQGAIVMYYDFGRSRIDGVSRYVPGLPPMIFLDQQAPGDRNRRTLAHEIAHLIMHVGRVPSPECENEADIFASELLLPGREIQCDFAMGVNLHRLLALKAKWGVSIQALIMRAKDLDMITPSQQRALFIRLSERGWRKVEPAPMVPETPHALRAVIDNRLSDGRSLEELADRVKCSLDDFEATYCSKPKFRLVE